MPRDEDFHEMTVSKKGGFCKLEFLILQNVGLQKFTSALRF